MRLPNYKQIRKLMNFANAQAVTRDLFLEGAFVDIHKPKHIVEMGSCFGGMAIYFDQYLKSPYTYSKQKPAFFTLIENFSGSEWSKDLTEAQNIKILQDILTEKNMSIPYKIVTNNSLDSIDKGYDVFRYDGYSDYNVFKNYLDNADENSLIIIHDFGFNLEVTPIFFAMKYTIESNLYPILFGKMTSIWTKSKDYKSNITNKFLKLYGADNLKTSWLEVKYRPHYDWKFTENNVLDFNNALVSRGD